VICCSDEHSECKILHLVVGGACDVIGQLRDAVHGCSLGNSEPVWPV